MKKVFFILRYVRVMKQSKKWLAPQRFIVLCHLECICGNPKKKLTPTLSSIKRFFWKRFKRTTLLLAPIDNIKKRGFKKNNSFVINIWLYLNGFKITTLLLYLHFDNARAYCVLIQSNRQLTSKLISRSKVKCFF